MRVAIGHDVEDLIRGGTLQCANSEVRVAIGHDVEDLIRGGTLQCELIVK